MGNISEILEGWRNHIAPPEKLKELITITSEERLSICIGCEFNNTPNKIKLFSRCKSCGCPLIQKSKSLQSECPMAKWSRVVTPEEENEIKLAINGEKDSKEGPPMEATDSN